MSSRSTSGRASSSHPMTSYLPSATTEQENAKTKRNATICAALSALLYTAGWLTSAIASKTLNKSYADAGFVFVPLFASLAVAVMCIREYFFKTYRFYYVSLHITLIYCGAGGMVMAQLLDSQFANAYGSVPYIVTMCCELVALILQVIAYFLYG